MRYFVGLCILVIGLFVVHSLPENLISLGVLGLVGIEGIIFPNSQAVASGQEVKHEQ